MKNKITLIVLIICSISFGQTQKIYPESTEFDGFTAGFVKTDVNGKPTQTTTVSSSEIENDAVTNTKLANMAEGTIKGRKSGTGDPQDLSVSDVKDILNLSAEYVTLSGSQTIAGTKTFSNSVVVPDATLGTHAPNLEQVQEMVEDASYQSGFKIFTFPIDVEWTTDSSKNITLSSTISETDWERTVDYTIMWNVGADATANKVKFDYEAIKKGITVNTIERNSSGNLVISLSGVSSSITIPAGAWIKLDFE